MKPLHGLVPMAGVTDIERSIAFYTRLGFEEKNRHTPEGETTPVWAWLKSGTAHLMLSLADQPVVPSQQGVLFYMYAEDVVAYHDELGEDRCHGRSDSPSLLGAAREFQVDDPDGYCPHDCPH
jgi:catechol 2,3-dioxygenase-like lactoylglutathione lyase family enzyme